VIVPPDVNVLVAIAWPPHVHHRDAIRWFDAVADSGWATSSATELGFVRMCMNPAVVGRGTSATVAIKMIGKLGRVGAHTFWADEVSAADFALVGGRLQGYRQVTDAHLALLAATHGGVVATYDRGVSGLVDGQEVLVLEGE